MAFSVVSILASKDERSQLSVGLLSGGFQVVWIARVVPQLTGIACRVVDPQLIQHADLLTETFRWLASEQGREHCWLRDRRWALALRTDVP